MLQGCKSKQCGKILTGVIETYLMHYLNGYLADDRYNCRSTNEEDIAELTRKLQFPLEDIMRAVQEVGCDKEAVEEYIRDRYNRS